MSRETITGVLHVIQTRKRRGSLLEDLILRELEQAGRIDTEYYPPTYFLLTEQTVRDRLPSDAQGWGLDDHYQFRFKGRPKALSPDLKGHRITVRATVEPFHNHLGGYLARPQVMNVGDYVECPFHDDPYDEPSSGSSRVFCKHRDPSPVLMEKE